MQYSILELERIEKVLQAKLHEASEAYHERERIVKAEFGKQWKGSPAMNGSHEFNQNLKEDWEKYKREDADLMFLKGEVELFQEGVNTLLSYWNSSVEIFIDNLRTKIEQEFPEKKRYVINPGPDGKGQHP